MMMIKRPLMNHFSWIVLQIRSPLLKLIYFPVQNQTYTIVSVHKKDNTEQMQKSN